MNEVPSPNNPIQAGDSKECLGMTSVVSFQLMEVMRKQKARDRSKRAARSREIQETIQLLPEAMWLSRGAHLHELRELLEPAAFRKAARAVCPELSTYDRGRVLAIVERLYSEGMAVHEDDGAIALDRFARWQVALSLDDVFQLCRLDDHELMTLAFNGMVGVIHLQIMARMNLYSPPKRVDVRGLVDGWIGKRRQWLVTL